MAHSFQVEYLKFPIQILKLVNLWPQIEENPWNSIKESFVVVVIFVTTFPLLFDFVMQFDEDDVNISDLVESLVALIPLYGVIFVAICFRINKFDIKQLVEDLARFEKYQSVSVVREAENGVSLSSKLFISYGIVGNLCYGLMPFLNYQHCRENRSPHMVQYGIPCGLVARFILPFDYEESPVFEIVVIEEIFVCCLGTMIILTITMLLSGILIHTTSHLKNLRKMIKKVSDAGHSETISLLRRCVCYHVCLIDYVERVNKCFGQMMLFHITGTGMVISALGFEIITKGNYLDNLRFMFHLAGWLAMLFLVCHYGQILMDESALVARAIYEMSWYNKSPKIRQDLSLILMESQNVLTLKAVGLKPMCLSTFLWVLYSAYSYFTLLLKFKS